MRDRRLSLILAAWTVGACLLLLPRFSSAGSRIGSLTHSSVSRLRAIGTDLDADCGPALIRASRSTLHEWAHRHLHFRSTRSRVAFRLTLTPTYRHGLDDGDEDSSDTVAPTTFAPFTPLLSPLPRAPDLVASDTHAPHPSPAARSFTPVDSFLPRPPPAYAH